MKQAVIIHGTVDENEYFESHYPSPSNAHWIPWMQRQLLRHGWLCQTPEMPMPYSPDYDQWKQVFEQQNPQSLSLAIGHSAGASFLLKYLQTHSVPLEKLILVAPWLDPEKTCGDFLNTTLKSSPLLNIGEIHLLFSEDDDADIHLSKDRILQAYPQTIFHHYLNFGHFTSGKTGQSFTELWNLCR